MGGPENKKTKPGSFPNAERSILIVEALFDAEIPTQKYGRYKRIS